MSTHTIERRTRAPNPPDARPVGPHLVVEEIDRVPGAHPESHLRVREQRAYAERYLRCLHCGAERLRARDFPDECAAKRADGAERRSGADGRPD